MIDFMKGQKASAILKICKNIDESVKSSYNVPNYICKLLEFFKNVNN